MAEGRWGESIRTDLAHEANELAMQRQGQQIPGVQTQAERKGPTEVTRVLIQTPEAGTALNKQPGYYVTIESQAFRGRDKDELESAAQVVAEEVRGFIRGLNLNDEAAALVVGLGNWNATPDALGPKVVEKVLVTRHLFYSSPPEKRVSGRFAPFLREYWDHRIGDGEIVAALVRRSVLSFYWWWMLWLQGVQTGSGLQCNWRIPEFNRVRGLETNAKELVRTLWAFQSLPWVCRRWWRRRRLSVMPWSRWRRKRVRACPARGNQRPNRQERL